MRWRTNDLSGSTMRCRFGEGVERAACKQEISDEGAEGDGGGHIFGAPTGGLQVTREEGLEMQALDEVTDNGCGANFEGFEGGAVEANGHRCLGKGGRECCLGRRQIGGKERRGSKFFLLVKARGRERESG